MSKCLISDIPACVRSSFAVNSKLLSTSPYRMNTSSSIVSNTKTIQGTFLPFLFSLFFDIGLINVLSLLLFLHLTRMASH